MNHSYRAAARQRKAHAIVEILGQLATEARIDAYREAGPLADLARDFTDAEWGMLALIAGVRPPSKVTQTMVIDIMAARDAVQP
jgi:hypothetical protein